MLIIGNFGLSIDQAKVQMAVVSVFNLCIIYIIKQFFVHLQWAILAAPLIMSNDLRSIRPEFVEILTNPHIVMFIFLTQYSQKYLNNFSFISFWQIRINQDPMGLQGRLVRSEKLVYFYRKPVLPQSNGATSEAIAIVYRGTYGTVSTYSSNFYIFIVRLVHSFTQHKLAFLA